MTPSSKSEAPLLFLGGTAAKNNWRILFTDLLVEAGVPASGIFNPIVADWTPECQAAEDRAKAEAKFNIFWIASPQQEGNPISAYSIFEATCSLYDRPNNTVVVFDFQGYAEKSHPFKALTKISEDMKKRFSGAPIFTEQGEAIAYLVPKLKGTK